MENKSFVILTGVCIITHLIRTIYEILKHKKIIISGKLSFVIILTNMMLLWVSWFALCGFDTCRIDIAGVVRYAGVALSGTGVILFLTALFTIKALETYEGDLMTKGIYSKIRHPMYLGFIFWLIGFSVFNGAVYAMVLAVVFIANVLFWRHLEEKELIDKFPDYKDYRKKTFF